MSTNYMIEMLETSAPAKLVRFRPEFHGSERERRMLSIAPALFEWLMWPVKTGELIALKAQVKAHFSQFVKGELIDDLDFMKSVCDRRAQFAYRFSAEVWSIRPDFDPKHRFFGAFFQKDWFVIFSKQLRNLLEGDRWHDQIDIVVSEWDKLFVYSQRHCGKELSDYLTRAEHTDDRW